MSKLRMQKKKVQAKGFNNGFVRHDSVSVSRLLNDIVKYPVCDNTESNELFKEARTGNVAAKQKLIEGNMRLVLRIAREFSDKPDIQLDLFQEGIIGLADSIERFNQQFKINFYLFAPWWIRKRMIQFLHKKNIIHYPESLILKFKQIEKAAQKFIQENMREPSEEELIDLTGYSMKIFKEIPYYKSVNEARTYSIEDCPDEKMIFEMF